MTRREALIAVLFIVAMAVYLTWPQARHLGDAIVDHNDTYFSTWRLAWVAHALTVAPHHLYDANIFFPEARTLAYSDAMLFEGAIAAPLVWAGVTPVTTYNLMLLAGIASSGAGMLVLIQHLTGNSRAALIGASIFTLLPYRLEHVMHLELQWTIWIPLAWWALHLAFERPAFRRGALAGFFVALQFLSCIYYGVFLGLTSAVLVFLLAAAAEREHRVRGVVWTAAGAVLVAPLAWLYARPYVLNARTFGGRSVDEVARFSATPLSYVSAPFASAVWGGTASRFTGDELHLFPGLVAIVLAVFAVASARRRLVAVYAAIVAFAFVMSLGENAWLYSWLREHLFILRGFRAAARFSILAFAALAVLAAIGYEWIEARLTRRWPAPALMMACLVVLGLDTAPAPAMLVGVDRRPPDVYRALRSLPPAPVVEFPTAEPWSLPGYDAIYMFESTWHWRPLVNGYSGYVSEAYVSRLEQLQGFPDRTSMDCLARLGVRYVIVHQALYPEDELIDVQLGIALRPSLKLIGSYRDSVGRAQLFEIRRASPR